MDTNYDILMQQINELLENNGLNNFSATELAVVEHQSTADKSNFSITDLDDSQYVINACKIVFDVTQGKYVKICD